MLVTSRRPTEALLIETPAGTVRIVILASHGQNVRIGVQAPPEFRIIREELLDRPAPTGEAKS